VDPDQGIASLNGVWPSVDLRPKIVLLVWGGPGWNNRLAFVALAARRHYGDPEIV
jgi:hypothetical protein